MVGAKGFEPSTSWSRTRRASQAALRPDGGDLAIRVDTEYACQRDSQIITRRKDWATAAFIIELELFNRGALKLFARSPNSWPLKKINCESWIAIDGLRLAVCAKICVPTR